jgi:hypothetical protein
MTATFADIPQHVMASFVKADVEVWSAYCRIGKDQYLVSKELSTGVFEALVSDIVSTLQMGNVFSNNEETRSKVFSCFKLNIIKRLLNNELTLESFKALLVPGGRGLFTEAAFSRRAPDALIFQVIRALLGFLTTSQAANPKTSFMARIAVSYASIELFRHMMVHRKYCSTMTRPRLWPTQRMLLSAYLMCSRREEEYYMFMKQSDPALTKYFKSQMTRIKEPFWDSYRMRDELIQFRKHAYKDYFGLTNVTSF